MKFRIAFRALGALCLGLYLPSTSLFASPGSPDGSFDGNGAVNLTNDGTTTGDTGTAVLIQDDGKILALGLSDSCLLLARRNADGSPDQAFGAGGTPGLNKLCIGGRVEGWALTRQDDGKILVVGRITQQIAVLRFTEDGKLDASFNTQGTYPGVYSLNQYLFSFGRGIALQEDGKIIVAGEAQGDERVGVLLRLNTDGSLDHSFFGTGFTDVALQEGAVVNAFHGFIRQPDGKMVLGNTLRDTGTNTGLIYRFNPDGSPDDIFGFDGFAQPDMQNRINIQDVARQPDGKIVFTGTWYDGTDPYIYIGRIREDGMRDSDFGADGFTTVPLQETFQGGYSVAVQDNGQALVLGRSGDQWLTVSRFTTEGYSDASFGEFGTAAFPVGNRGFAGMLALQPDGKIVLIGSADGDIVLGRLNGNSSDLAVAAQVDRGDLEVDADYNFQITVSNNGPDASGMAGLTSLLSGAFKILESHADGGDCDLTQQSRCALGVIAPAQRRLVSIRAKYLGGAASDFPVARVDGGQVVEANPSNNEASVPFPDSPNAGQGSAGGAGPGAVPAAGGCSLQKDLP